MPTRVGVCSLFRNSERTLGYYRALLEHQLLDDVELVYSFVEGDSIDRTPAMLRAWAAQDPRVMLQTLPVEPVADFEDRVRKWALLGNAALEGALAQDVDHVLWCESDLALPPDLVTQLVQDRVDVVAPGIWLGGYFYDTWGFRGLDGRRFDNLPPHHPQWQSHGLFEVATAGSVVLFRRAVFDAGVRFRGEYENGLLVGACQDARERGFRVFADSRIAVVHPTTLWRAQQYRLDRVDLEGFDDDVFTVHEWTEMAREIRETESLALGSPDLPEDHPVFAGIRRRIQARIPGRAFALRSALTHERAKTWRLVIRDRAREGGPCPTASTR